jgi:hypothetical protein
MPTTPDGNALSRMNALKHGLHATDELLVASLTDQARAAFEDLRATIHSEYNPFTDQEKLLVDRIAIHYFRLFRVYQLEQLALSDSQHSPLAPASIIPHLDRFSLYDSRTSRQLKQLVAELRLLYWRRGDHSLDAFALSSRSSFRQN